MRIKTLHISLSLGLLCVIDIDLSAQVPDGQQQVKAAIVSIQQRIWDLTNPLEPFHCKQFVSIRKSISDDTGKQIVMLIKNGQLTTTQSEVGVGLLTGLSEAHYWNITSALLTTNTPEEILLSVINMPMPYGPCFANAYTNEMYKTMLSTLKSNSGSTRIKDSLDFILSGEAAKTYQDYLKHPDRYGYSPIQNDANVQ